MVWTEQGTSKDLIIQGGYNMVDIAANEDDIIEAKDDIPKVNSTTLEIFGKNVFQ